jgi:hypothetical protein
MRLLDLIAQGRTYFEQSFSRERIRSLLKAILVSGVIAGTVDGKYAGHAVVLAHHRIYLQSE